MTVAISGNQATDTFISTRRRRLANEVVQTYNEMGEDMMLWMKEMESCL